MRAAVVVVFGLWCVTTAPALGRREAAPRPEAPGGGEPIAATGVTYRGVDPSSGQLVEEFWMAVGVDAGFMTVEIKRPRDLVYALLKDGEEYRNPLTGVELERSVGDAVAGKYRQAGVSIPMVYEAAGGSTGPGYPRVPLAEYGKGTLGLSEEEGLYLRGEASSMKVWWLSTTERRPLTLWLGKAGGSWVRVRFEVVTEMFEGEAELFGRVLGDYTPEQKALALLDRALEGAEDFRSEAGFPADGAFWSMYEGVEGVDAAAGRLRVALERHFAYYLGEGVEAGGSTVSLPYLEFRPETFNAIYGDKRQIYVWAYLRYLYAKGKPLLSYLIQKEVEPHQAVVFAQGGYDWRNYQAIGRPEGVTLAENALRYLTWGVEYTQYAGQNSMALEDTAYRVVESYEPQIREWIDNSPTNKGAAENYLAKDLSPQPVRRSDNQSEGGEIGRVHALEVGLRGKRISVVASRPESGAALPVSRIDVFTGRNFAWEAERIAEVVIEGGGNGRGEALRDRKLYAWDKENNLHLERAGGGAVKFGYRFTGIEKVGGLVVVNGGSVARSDVAGYRERTKQEGPLWVIEYLPASGGGWTSYSIGGRGRNEEFVVDPMKYRELTWDYRQGQELYEDHTQRPGWGLASAKYYSTDAPEDSTPHAGYVYIALPQGIECRGIRIVDRTWDAGQPESRDVVVSELMVFDTPPVDYLTKAVTVGTTVRPWAVYAGGAGGVKAVPEGAWAPGNENDRTVRLVTNGDMSRGYSVGYGSSGLGRVEVNFANEVTVKQVIVWERDHRQGGAGVLGQEVSVLGASTDLLESGYFETYVASTAKGRDELERAGGVKTPFAGAGKDVLRGNALPYASRGIDSPRTFNYKMLEQLDARGWYAEKVETDRDRFTGEKTTLAVDAAGVERYAGGYVSQSDVARAMGKDGAVSPSFVFRDRSAAEVGAKYEDEPGEEPKNREVKPFLPGMLITTPLGYSADRASPYSVDKVTGVDALGLLMGAVAMTDSLRGRVYDAFNRKTAEKLDSYYRMAGGAAGLGADGKPVYQAKTDGESYLAGEYRWTAGDLERSTVLIPDLTELREGDILVRYHREGEPHVGVVVGFQGGRPGADEAADAILGRVLVVSVRRGFRTVTLGTWGNGENTFGGFTVEPRMYQARRLLRLKDGLEAPGPMKVGADSWEVVQARPVKVRDYYHNAQVPLSYISYGEGRAYEIVTKGWRYLEHLPPTSFDAGAGAQSMLSSLNTGVAPYDSSTRQAGMAQRVSENTGWRDYRPESSIASWHQGADITVPTGMVAGDSSYGLNIYAPQDGAFYYPAEPPEQRLQVGPAEFIDVSGRQGDVLTAPYGFDTYGVVGIFISNPGSPREGRVYVYAHMGDQGQEYDQVHAAFLRTALRGFHPEPTEFPVDYGKRIGVQKGQWIGRVGYNGLSAQSGPSGSHIHLEVYEYFERDETGNALGRWRRIDPLSLFEPDAIRERRYLDAAGKDSSDHVSDTLRQQLQNPPDGSGLEAMPAAEASKVAGQHFMPWPGGAEDGR